MRITKVTAATPALVAGITLLAFLPVLHNGFTNWDDPPNLLNNPSYRGLGWSHLVWMFTSFHNSLYRPLTWITFGADYLIWGMNPFGYHLTTLILHTATAVLFYFIALRLLSIATGAEQNTLTFAAAFAALIFAVHPLRVEPVAWTQARENVLAGFFFMLTLIFYLKATAEGAAKNYRWMAAAWISYALCLLGKGAFVTVPIGLMILDYYPLRRFDRSVWMEKIPFFGLAIIAGLLAIYGKQQSDLFYGFTEYTLLKRFGLAAYGLFFYLSDT